MTDAYHGTRGYTADNASKDAAEADAASGKTNELQEDLLTYAKVCGRDGVTVHEARLASGEHHGRVSSALTKLHIAGRLVALRERRGNAGIYVHPDYVNGRETRPYRRQNQPLTVDEIADVLQKHHLAGWENECTCGWLGEDRAQQERHVAEALTAALRGEYGVTKRGEATAAPAGFDSESDALMFLAGVTGMPYADYPVKTLLRRAQQRTHPDAGGDATTFQRVSLAEAKLREAGRL